MFGCANQLFLTRAVSYTLPIHPDKVFILLDELLIKFRLLDDIGLHQGSSGFL